MSDLKKFGKKLFTSVVSGMTVFSMSFGAFLPAVVNAAEACPELEAGDLFKVPNNSAVYYVNADMERMYFPNSEVYKTWFEDFSGVVEIPNTCVSNYPSGGGVNFRPGSRLYKTVVSPDVYAVGPSNMKHKLASEAVAKALYGDKWASLVRDLADVFDANYKDGPAVTEAKPHNGMLVKTSGDDSVFYVWNGELKEVSGTLGMTSKGDVRTVSQEVFDSLEVASGTATPSSLSADPSQMGTGSSSTDTTTTDTTTTDTTTTSQGTLSVALAAGTPSGTYAVQSAARVEFTKLNLSATGGDVTIKSFVVKRTGTPARDADLSKVNVVDPDGNLLNSLGKTLNADSLATFTEDVMVKSGETKTYTLVADMASSGVIGGDLPRLALYSVETDAKVASTLPVEGNAVQTNTGVTLGTVTLAEGAVVGTITEQVGDKDINLANVKITVATNDFQVEKIVLYNDGSAATTDFADLELRYNDNKVATGVMSGKYVTFKLDACTEDCKIGKGKNKTYEVYGDIVSGSARTMNLDVKQASDVLAKDLKHSYYATPTNNASAMSNTVTVAQGNLTVSKTNDVIAGNIPEDSTGVALGSWNFKVQGEPITVKTVVFRLTTTGSVLPTGFDQLVLYSAKGDSLTGGQDGVGSTSPGYATSTDSFTLPVGDNILTLKATLDSTPAVNDTVTVAIDMANTSNFEATGENSSETITLGTYANPQAAVSANVQTIKAGSLRVTTLSVPSAKTLAAGTNNVEFAQLLFDGSNSSEDIRVTQVKMTDTTDAAAKTIDVQNIRLMVDKDGDSYDGAGTEEALNETKSGSDSTAGNNQTFTFNLSGTDQFVVKAGKKVVVRVVGNIAGGAVTGSTSSHTFAVDNDNSNDDVVSVGVKTGNTVTETKDTANGQAITVGAAGGTVQVSLDPSNPTAALMTAGTSGVTLGTFNFYATTTENVELDTLMFTMNVTDTSSSSFKDYALLYAEDEDGVKVGSVVPTSTTPVIDFNDGSFVVKTDDSDGKKLYLKANLASIGPQESVTVGGHRLGLKINAAGDVVAKGNLTGTGSIEYLSTSNVPTGNTHYMYKAAPTVEVLSVGGTLANGANDLFKFKVTANKGDIGLYKFVFDMSTTTATVTNVEVLDVTESTEVQLYNSATTAFVNGYFQALFDTDSSGTGDGGEERTVSVSKPRLYLVRGTVTGVASGASISTRLGGDAATWVENANLMSAANTVDSDVHDDFIWSDRSAGAHATTTNDWVNGFLVSGLNSVSTTPTVVAK
ncbi:MAG: hypothetical protein HYY51_01135 [Candidatus Magasanikbacteria bacterium]|nr:hypothetical protein [Candidatus Magasanikbacteria bacterium]